MVEKINDSEILRTIRTYKNNKKKNYRRRFFIYFYFFMQFNFKHHETNLRTKFQLMWINIMILIFIFIIICIYDNFDFSLISAKVLRITG